MLLSVLDYAHFEVLHEATFVVLEYLTVSSTSWIWAFKQFLNEKKVSTLKFRVGFFSQVLFFQHAHGDDKHVFVEKFRRIAERVHSYISGEVRKEEKNDPRGRVDHSRSIGEFIRPEWSWMVQAAIHMSTFEPI